MLDLGTIYQLTGIFKISPRSGHDVDIKYISLLKCVNYFFGTQIFVLKVASICGYKYLFMCPYASPIGLLLFLASNTQMCHACTNNYVCNVVLASLWHVKTIYLCFTWFIWLLAYSKILFAAPIVAAVYNFHSMKMSHYFWESMDIVFVFCSVWCQGGLGPLFTFYRNCTNTWFICLNKMYMI